MTTTMSPPPPLHCNDGAEWIGSLRHRRHCLTRFSGLFSFFLGGHPRGGRLPKKSLAKWVCVSLSLFSLPIRSEEDRPDATVAQKLLKDSFSDASSGARAVIIRQSVKCLVLKALPFLPSFITLPLTRHICRRRLHCD